MDNTPQLCVERTLTGGEKKRAVWKPHHTRNIEQHHRIKEEEMELDHIALIVSKEENLAFYKKLGFIEKNRIERGCDTVVFMECNGLLLEVFIDPNHPARVTNPEAMGLRHIAFVVESLEEVMSVVEGEGVGLGGRGISIKITKDPEGQPIELKEKNTPEDGEKNR